MNKKISTFSIIDDDQLFQFTIKKVLQSTELVDRVLQFGDGESALSFFRNNWGYQEKLPDVIFLDLNMPILNGWQFLEEFIKFEQLDKSITVYICTASANPKDLEMFKRFNGVTGYLLKPISKKEIYSILDKEIHGKSPFRLN
ncbi:response regulator [Desertivirga arenae]|uniref:response regulator n=1 Tax=Desertivirga arenae TaxID=2810309 RepID=UPI001A9608C6|nr:response regulator [Pedobacter sp. SYSU D00823]